MNWLADVCALRFYLECARRNQADAICSGQETVELQSIGAWLGEALRIVDSMVDELDARDVVGREERL